MNGLALCAGYGGLELGIERVLPGSRTVCYVEGECFAVQHLVKKMEEGRLDNAPIWSNVKTFDGKPWRGKVDWISGGFPCQPYSTAGKQMGEEDPRDLWPDFVRIIGEVRPGFLFLENVPNIVKLRLDQIVLDLDKLGYHASWCVVAASDVGALHRRKRWFLFGVRHIDSNSNSFGWNENQQFSPEGKFDIKRVRREMADAHNKRMGPCCSRTSEESSGQSEQGCDHIGGSKCYEQLRLNKSSNLQENVSNTDSQRIKRIRGINGTTQEIKQAKRNINPLDKWGGRFESMWEVEPSMGRLVDGASDWVDKLRILGNGVVPQQAAYAFQILGERLAAGIVEKRTPKD